MRRYTYMYKTPLGELLEDVYAETDSDANGKFWSRHHRDTCMVDSITSTPCDYEGDECAEQGCEQPSETGCKVLHPNVMPPGEDGERRPDGKRLDRIAAISKLENLERRSLMSLADRIMAEFFQDVADAAESAKQKLSESRDAQGCLSWAMEAGLPPMRTYSVAQTAKYSGISINTLYDEINAGRLATVCAKDKKNGTRIPVDAMDEWMEENTCSR